MRPSGARLEPHQKTDHHSWLETISVILFFGLIFAILLSRAAYSDLSHDEYQFVASGEVLAQSGFLPYIGFPYLHMPYMPFVYGIASFIGDNHFLAMRIMNQVFDLGSVVLLFMLVYRALNLFSRPSRFALSAVAALLMIMAPSLIAMDGRALNHSLPVFLSLAAFALYSKAKTVNFQGYWLFLSGLAVSVAAGLRLSYAVMAVPFLLTLLVDPLQQPVKQRLKICLSFCAGLLVGLLPAILFFLINPGKFYYGNFLYIRLNTLYRQGLGLNRSMSFPAKLSYFFKIDLKNPISIVIYLGAISAGMVILAQWFRSKKRIDERMLLLLVLAFVLLAAGFAPTPLQPQYFYAPVPFLILFFFTLLFPTILKWPALTWAGSILLLLILWITNGVSTLTMLMKLPVGSDWVPVRIHQLSEHVKQYVPTGKVLTLAPILPLEVGLNTYSAFIVGPFSWRTASFLSPARRATYGILSPDDLSNALMMDPPSAILTGMEASYEGFGMYTEGDLETPFEEYARANDFKPVELPCDMYLKCVLWVKNSPP